MKKLLKLDMGTLSELLQKLFSSQSAPLKYPVATVVYSDLNYLQQVFQSPVSSNSWFPVTENTSWHSGYAWLCADCLLNNLGLEIPDIQTTSRISTTIFFTLKTV